MVGHNVKFDINIIGAELHRLGIITKFSDLEVIDTCTETTANLCQIKGGRSGKFKFPTLIELYEFLFSNQFEQAHNASADVEATARSFFELIRSDVLSKSDFENFEDTNKELKLNYNSKIPLYGLNHINLKEESKKLKEVNTPAVDKSSSNIEETFSKNNFVHLHNNSQFSVLQSTSRIADLVKKIKTAEFGMSAVAITDKANMMGAFHFYRAIKNYNDQNEDKIIKPIIGCELNVCENHLDKSHRDDGFQTVFLAKNKIGYQNLIKMCSLGYTDGFYYVPRVDKNIVSDYREGLIVLSGDKYGEISSKILNVGERQAEESYFKSSDEMNNLFKDLPDAINNINEIVEKVDFFDLNRDVLLPKFNIPSSFKPLTDDIENEYLKHITYLGAEKIYKKIDDSLKEKIDFELSVIKNSGYPGYFLIVQDLIDAARRMVVSVGPC